MTSKFKLKIESSFQTHLIFENSRRFLILFGLVLLSQIVFLLLELLKIIKTSDNIILSRVIVIGVCIIFSGLIYILNTKKYKYKQVRLLAILTSTIQLITLFFGCYFVIFMFQTGIFSFSAFLLTIFVVSLTCIRSPYFSGIFLLLIFLGLALFISKMIEPIGDWLGEFLIAMVFVVLILIGNVLNYFRHYTLYKQEREITEMNNQLKTLAETDELTGIYNRRKSLEFIESSIAYSRRYQNELSFAMLDIDHFKSINDRFGHDVGDAVLKQFTTEISKMLRNTDVFGRWGGDEFIIITPNCDAECVFTLIERIRKNIESFHFDTAGHVTFSVGVYTYKDGTAFDSVRKADDALYQSKQNGRNQTNKFIEQENE